MVLPGMKTNVEGSLTLYIQKVCAQVNYETNLEENWLILLVFGFAGR